MILYHRSYGSGDPLIILHGLFGSSDNWQTFAKSISDRFQVITMDIRNHGLSAHVDDFNYDLISMDVLDTVKALGIESFYLMGHSMGGKAAACFTTHHADRVKKLIVIDIALRAYPPHHQRYFDAMLSLDLENTANRIEADEWLKQFIDDVIVRQFILKNLVRTEEGKFKWKFNLYALFQHYDEINIPISTVTPVPIPVLFIKGSLSDYIKDEDETHIQSIFNQAEIKSILHAGHWVHADRPDELKEMVMEFLQLQSGEK